MPALLSWAGLGWAGLGLGPSTLWHGSGGDSQQHPKPSEETGRTPAMCLPSRVPIRTVPGAMRGPRKALVIYLSRCSMVHHWSLVL